ncbi:MAG: leucine-rich repeat protein [Eubacteriales bacterium]|nr:leucine-rich repeat protein [Eubacteriales bacterium]
MKTTKRWAMLLSLIMAVSMLPAQALAADIETEQTLTVLDESDLPEYESYSEQTRSSETGAQAGNLTWELNDGVLVISGNGEMTETPWRDRADEIRSVQIQQGVTSIAYYAFFNCDNLTRITIPDSVTTIEGRAFYNCDNLSGVTIPDGVTTIESETFAYCTNLTNITIPDSVTTIEEYAFSNCTSLTNVDIPDSVTTIERGAFSETPWLEAQGDFPIVNGILLRYQGNETDIIIPDSVTTIGGNAFSNCANLTSVKIPDSVTTIDIYAFYYCTNLTDVVISDSVIKIGGWAFHGTPWLEAKGDFPVVNDILLEYQGDDDDVTIPDNVSSIAYAAFDHCMSLTRVTIPSSVKSIDDSAFAFCFDLTEIYFEGDAPEMVSGDNGWGTFYCVDAVAYYPKGASGWDEAITKGYGGTLIWMEYDPADPKPDQPSKPVSDIFTDITPNAWYTQAIQYVYDKGIMKGMGDATFAPGDSMTRAMVAQIMYAQAGSPAVSGDMPFSDVPVGRWYYDAILWANQNGVVAGMGNGTFAPNDNITRQEYAAILYRYENSPAVSGSLDFPDADTVSSWAMEAVLWANQNGIINGTVDNGTTKLDPKGTATRAQSAVILMGYLEK